jgi:hypothetical protein
MTRPIDEPWAHVGAPAAIETQALDDADPVDADPVEGAIDGDEDESAVDRDLAAPDEPTRPTP